jgi:hypothetical protein
VSVGSECGNNYVGYGLFNVAVNLWHSIASAGVMNEQWIRKEWLLINIDSITASVWRY